MIGKIMQLEVDEDRDRFVICEEEKYDYWVR